ncbi:MAG: RagB/SusD family nutrient uptake outer membrane protein [Candidatus Cryptobacteroides sp.]
MKRIKHTGLLLCLCAGLSGCLEREPNIITEDQFYTSTEAAQLGLNAVYGVLNSWQLYGCNLTLDLNYNSDISMYLSSTNATMKGASLELDANSASVSDPWIWLYKGIGNANAFLEKVAGTDLDPDGSMAAQARFLRAWYHFVLAQNWLDVPLKTTATESYKDVECEATPQHEVMKWVVSEMEAILPDITRSLEHAPSDVTWTTVHGILGRIYLYMAGEAVSGVTDEEKHEYFGKAAEHCKTVIDSGLHRLNPDYEQIFINYISDKYDHEYYESMWEADFYGDRSSSSYWGNSRWGELNGLRCSDADTDYASHNVNWSYGLFGNTYYLWELYMEDDRTPNERGLSVITDKRQDWNIPGFTYNGSKDVTWLYPYGGDPTDFRKLIAGVDRTPYYNTNDPSSPTTNTDPTYSPGGRNIGKFRREVQYEGRKNFKSIWTGINVPLLRYSDVLLMYAEAVNEYEGRPSEELYDLILPIRERAGIETLPYARYNTFDKFRQFIRNERARELCFEGLRKHDLIRWGIYLESMEYVRVLATNNTKWANSSSAKNFILLSSRMSERNNYLPIPSIELAVNKKLKQNPLW